MHRPRHPVCHRYNNYSKWITYFLFRNFFFHLFWFPDWFSVPFLFRVPVIFWSSLRLDLRRQGGKFKNTGRICWLKGKLPKYTIPLLRSFSRRRNGRRRCTRSFKETLSFFTTTSQMKLLPPPVRNMKIGELFHIT